MPKGRARLQRSLRLIYPQKMMIVEEAVQIVWDYHLMGDD
jgi:hypothetical protein